MTTQQTSVTLHWPRIALTEKVVPDEGLLDEEGTSLLSDEEVTNDGLCYVRVHRAFVDGTYLAHVAASLELLQQQPATIIVTAEQLRYTLPLDVRTDGKCPERLTTMLQAHAAATQPARKVATEGQTQEQPALAAFFEALHTWSIHQVNQTPSDVSFIPLDDEVVEVTPDELQATIEPRIKEVLTIGKLQVRPNIGFCSYHVQQALLRDTLHRLMARLYGCQDQAHALVLESRCKLIAQLQCWQRFTHQRVVNVVSDVNEQQQAMWRLVIGAPASLVAAYTVPLFPYGRVS
jgi:hypothetical protein